MMKRKFMLCLLILPVFLLLAQAGTARASLEVLGSVFSGEPADWNTLGVSRKTLLPVYGAPFDDAWRGAGGKAAVSASETFDILGDAQNGAWLMVSYRMDSANSGTGRIGWIRRPEGCSADVPELYWSRLLCEVREGCVLTDDPAGSGRAVRDLVSGEKVIAMLRLSSGDRSWILAETEAEGKTVWGFAPASALREIRPLHLEGDTLVIEEGVTLLGLMGSDEADDPDEGDDESRHSGPVIEKGEIWAETLYLRDEWGQNVRTLSFPSTLRGIGMESICFGSLAELRLPGSLEDISSFCFHAVSVDRMILAADYILDSIPGYDVTVTEWVVEEGSPKYLSRDGVLFSADGKVLLSYPSGRKDTHYDVPKGTEEIGGGAFSDDAMSLPLQTISLPVGLKRIGEYAFSGCGRLHTLTVPVTVTEIAPTAFAQCASLERLSLPSGFSYEGLRNGYMEAPDLSRYMGDNGATLEAEKVDPWETPVDRRFNAYSVWLCTETGDGMVPLYPDADASEPFSEQSAGYRTYIGEVRGSRGRINLARSGRDCWVDLGMTLPICEEVLFEISRFEPTEEGWASLADQGIRTVQYDYWDDEYMECCFAGVVDYTQSVYDAPETFLPVSQVTLYTRSGKPDQVFAYLYSESSETPVRIYDAPDGIPVSFTYRGEQAEILSREEGWVRVRTVRAEGWVPEASAVLVYHDSE